MHLAVFVTFLSDIVDQRMDRIDNRIERIFVTGQHHPGPERRRALLVKRIKRQVDNVAHGAFARPGFQDCLRDQAADFIG